MAIDYLDRRVAFCGLHVSVSGHERYFSFRKSGETRLLQPIEAIKKMRKEAEALERQWQAKCERIAERYSVVRPPTLTGHTYKTGIRGLSVAFSTTRGRLRLCLTVSVGTPGRKNYRTLCRAINHRDCFYAMWRECVKALAQFRGIELPQAWIDAKPSLATLRKLSNASAEHYKNYLMPEGLQF